MTRDSGMGQAYSVTKFGGELVRLGARVGAGRGGPMTRKTKILLAAGILALVGGMAAAVVLPASQSMASAQPSDGLPARRVWAARKPGLPLALHLEKLQSSVWG